MNRIVVMGVAGSGKTSVAEALAARSGLVALDADDFHSEQNVAKMASGEALTDDDRLPWLDRLAAELAARDAVVLACSALRRPYRDVLRSEGDVRFVFLDLDQALATERVLTRSHHYMGGEMVASQFETLERPASDEADVVAVDASRSLDEVLAEIRERL